MTGIPGLCLDADLPEDNTPPSGVVGHALWRNALANRMNM
jgi:hypothetical protein